MCSGHFCQEDESGTDFCVDLSLRHWLRVAGGGGIASYVMLISLLNIRKPTLLVDVRGHVMTVGRRLQDAERKINVPPVLVPFKKIPW